MSQLYVPIDYTGLAEVIPAGDDILYSTLARGNILGVSVKQKRKHKAHVLVTQNGFAATNSLRKKELKFDYYPWTDGKFFKKRRSFSKKRVVVFYRTAGQIQYQAVLDPQFEDKASFVQRKKVFGAFCKDLYLKANGLL